MREGGVRQVPRWVEEGGGQASLLNLITWLRIAAWVVLRGGSAHSVTSGQPLAAAWLDGTEFNCYPKCQPFQTHSISSLTFKEEGGENQFGP